MNNLIKVRKCGKYRITEIVGGRGVQRHLAQLGIGPGSIITVDRQAPFLGPVLIEHDGSKFAIGMGIAAKIIVEVVD